MVAATPPSTQTTPPSYDREAALRISGYAALAALPFFFLFGLPILPKASDFTINPISILLWPFSSRDLLTSVSNALVGAILLAIILGAHLFFALRRVPLERPSHLFLKILWHHFIVSLPILLISTLLLVSALLPGGGGENGAFALLAGYAGIYLVIGSGVLVLLATTGVVGWLSGKKTATIFISTALLIFFILLAILTLNTGCAPADVICYAQLAEEKNDDQICRQLEKEWNRDQCFEIVAQRTGDASICSNSKSGFGRCVYDVIELTNQTQHCSLLGESATRCFLDFAKQRHDCTIIPEENSELRFNCQYTQAIKENNCVIIAPEHTVARQMCPETAQKYAALPRATQEGMWYSVSPE